MNLTLEKALEVYQGYWTRLNVVNGLIADLKREREEIKAKQRQLANGLVSNEAARLQGEKGEEEGRG